MIRKLKLEPEKTMAERKKIYDFKNKNNSNRIKNIISKQIIKAWKQFIQIKI